MSWFNFFKKDTQHNHMVDIMESQKARIAVLEQELEQVRAKQSKTNKQVFDLNFTLHKIHTIIDCLEIKTCPNKDCTHCMKDKIYAILELVKKY